MVVDHFRKSTDALELASVSGVGASQWAQAWALMRASYNRSSDTAVLTAKTGARQTGGGVYKIEISGVMSGPISAKTDVGTEDDDDDDSTDLTSVMHTALTNLNLLCSTATTPRWLDRAGLRRIIKDCSPDEQDKVIEYIETQAHVHVITDRTDTKRQYFAQCDGAKVPEIPRGSEPLTKAAIAARYAAFRGEDDDEEGGVE